jgi:hypothetical protein
LKSIMRKFLRLSWRDKWLIIQVIAMLLYVRIGLCWLGYQRLRNHLAGRITPSKTEIRHAVHIGKLVNAAGLRSGANCLQRSLTLWWLLRLHGIASDLHFGIPRQPYATFTAHVWLQIGTTIINDSHDIHETYAEFTHISEQKR